METRVAIIGIIVEDAGSVEKLNRILHDYGSYIIGRMGIPYKEKHINIISIAVDAPNDVISALSGKLGKLPGVSAKAVYSKLPIITNEVSIGKSYISEV
ncbi:TM1266 family iron-only hydrogenase system putative regulator [[Clostridium] fimetarium]|uniref:Putative iron-only hydrogenase system regulator n=1 Tax=[Clostridium] fimetarium TaxID=99656 RepID=A0A1I0QHD5_9FIRM|nr:TM1266 family iron-only hydrogenase system putative regulator [[Clostridium] fimetarium]SEW26346.1 putative iron-only hydrogenase system regulator [[Clostridium] fimetarium]